MMIRVYKLLSKVGLVDRHMFIVFQKRFFSTWIGFKMSKLSKEICSSPQFFIYC